LRADVGIGKQRLALQVRYSTTSSSMIVSLPTPAAAR